jgi:hypothetical protein
MDKGDKYETAKSEIFQTFGIRRQNLKAMPQITPSIVPKMVSFDYKGVNQ